MGNSQWGTFKMHTMYEPVVGSVKRTGTARIERRPLAYLLFSSAGRQSFKHGLTHREEGPVCADADSFHCGEGRQFGRGWSSLVRASRPGGFFGCDFPFPVVNDGGPHEGGKITPIREAALREDHRFVRAGVDETMISVRHD